MGMRSAEGRLDCPPARRAEQQGLPPGGEAEGHGAREDRSRPPGRDGEGVEDGEAEEKPTVQSSY